MSLLNNNLRTLKQLNFISANQPYQGYTSDVALSVLKGETSYNKAEIINQLRGILGIEKADKYFNFMLKTKVIEKSYNITSPYYLRDSTPF